MYLAPHRERWVLHLGLPLKKKSEQLQITHCVMLILGAVPFITHDMKLHDMTSTVWCESNIFKCWHLQAYVGRVTKFTQHDFTMSKTNITQHIINTMKRRQRKNTKYDLTKIANCWGFFPQNSLYLDSAHLITNIHPLLAKRNTAKTNSVTQSLAV